MLGLYSGAARVLQVYSDRVLLVCCVGAGRGKGGREDLRAGVLGGDVGPFISGLLDGQWLSKVELYHGFIYGI